MVSIVVEIFKFMRKHGYRTAKWDGELTCYREQFYIYDGAQPERADTILGDKKIQAWGDLNEKALDTLGEAVRWFHV